MRAGVYSPYLDTLGGGEKYVVGMMRALARMGYAVDLLWHDPDILPALGNRYAVDLSGVIVNHHAWKQYAKGNAFSRLRVPVGYDAFVVVSDGSLPLLLSRKNIVHFQVPFVGVRPGILAGLKRGLISHVVCNSAFTKRYVDATYGVRSDIVYPPVTQIPARKKKSYILSVGRFDNLLNAKRQDVLIQAFKQLKSKDWKLVLAGGCQHGQEYLQKLKDDAKGVHIEIFENPTWDKLETLFAEATIYWHAAGYGLDLEIHPEQAEHFGIAIAEAMSAKAVPVVYNGGGIPEIVTHGVQGFLWSTVEELLENTKQLIRDESLRKQIARAASMKATDYSWETFEDAFGRVIG